MAKSIIAVYGENRLAQAAARDLAAHGVDPSAIHVDAPPVEERVVVDDLTDRNVPEERVAIYAEAVRRGATLVIADTADEKADEAADLLDSHGSLDVENVVAQWRAEGWSPPPRTTTAARTEAAPGEMEVIEEEVRVGKRPVELGGVRARSFVTERPVREQVTLHEERINVHREPASEVISPREAEAAFTEGEVEVTARGEEPVVEKRAHVVEKVAIGKEATERTETIEETERRKDVEVERVDPTRRRD